MRSNDYRTSFYLDEQIYQAIIYLCDKHDLKLVSFFKKAFKYALKYAKNSSYDSMKKYINYPSEKKIKKIITIPKDLFCEIKEFCESPDIAIKRSEFYRMAIYFYLTNIQNNKINL